MDILQSREVESGKPGTINCPGYTQPGIMHNDVGHDNHIRTKFKESHCRCPDLWFQGHSARGYIVSH